MTKIVNAEELFPDWKQARPILKKFVEGVNGFKVEMHGNTINISLRIPCISGVLSTVPIKYRSTISNICYTTLKDRIPQEFIEKWKFCSINTSLIKHELDSHESYRVANGYRSLKGELAYKLGIFMDYYKSKWDLR